MRRALAGLVAALAVAGCQHLEHTFDGDALLALAAQYETAPTVEADECSGLAAAAAALRGPGSWSASRLPMGGAGAVLEQAAVLGRQAERCERLLGGADGLTAEENLELGEAFSRTWAAARMTVEATR